MKSNITKIFILIGLLFGIVLYFIAPSDSQIIPKPTTQIKREIVQPGVPTRLLIPSIGVDAAIEPVIRDSEGKMGVPVNEYNAGWYSLGVKPGERGNAVIDGHVNTPKLEPSIFARLETIKIGDSITVIDARNHSWNFTVVNIKKFATDTFPIENIFGNTDKIALNLITCSGIYDKLQANYTERVVVFSVLSTV